jgi:Flp pilus assembly protein TadB
MCEMPQHLYFRVGRNLGFRGWATILLALSLVVAIGVALAVIAVGVFLFLLPVIAVASMAFYLFPRARTRRAQYPRTRQPETIDGEFRILDDRRPRDPS